MRSLTDLFTVISSRTTWTKHGTTVISHSASDPCRGFTPHTLMSALPPRFSVLSSSSADHLSPTSSYTRFSLPSASIATAAAGTPKPSSRPNIYDRPLNKTRTAEVSASAFTFLFSEIVQYMQKRVSGIDDLERRYAQTITLTRIISG
jgi:hypothetical protein